MFEFSPVGTGWQETILYSVGQDGSAGCFDPWGGVVMDSAGNLYGLCLVSGFPQTAAVFQLSQSGGVWTQTVIYNYNSAADNNGGGGLAIDAKGNIFAMLSAAYGAPRLVELSPNGNGGWTPTALATFRKNIFPESVPTLDSAGNIYGTTQAGGAYGRGTVYEFSPGNNGKWTQKTLYSFGGSKNGIGPYSGIVLDVSGNIYGTASFGGKWDAGTVFELTPNGQGGYQEKLLWTFDLKDGDGPLSTLTMDSAGHLYGVTPSGGQGKNCVGPDVCGIAFEVSP